jgi:hypothetical protein
MVNVEITRVEREKYMKNSSGKGDKPRNCFSKQYRDNWDLIFNKQKSQKRPENKKNIVEDLEETIEIIS